MALNQLSTEARYAPGINVSARALLRISVALLGLRITFGQISELGWSTAAMVIITVPLTIGLRLGARQGHEARRPLRRSVGRRRRNLRSFRGNGHRPSRGRARDSERDTVVVIACITTYSTIAMVLYPALVSHLHLDPLETGRFLGGSIHDVAQVVAAGYASSPQAGDSATLVKLMRVAMLLPVVLVIHARGGARHRRERTEEKKSRCCPAFSSPSVVLAALNGFALVAKPVASVLTELSKWLLVISVAALGMKTSLREMMAVGTTAIALIAAETVFLGLLVLTWIMLAGAAPAHAADHSPAFCGARRSRRPCGPATPPRPPPAPRPKTPTPSSKRPCAHTRSRGVCLGVIRDGHIRQGHGIRLRQCGTRGAGSSPPNRYFRPDRWPSSSPPRPS